MDSTIENKVDITPHVSLLPKLGHSGYKIVEAISEFIDNSIDAKVKDQKLSIGIEINEKRLIITDNASGMNLDEITNALKLAYTASHQKKRLGQFGLGLKTAATSLGKKFTIKTSMSGENNWHIIIYDEDEWLKSNKWETEIRTEPKNNYQDHGTKITIERAKYKFYPNQVTNIKRDLSFRFASFIEAMELEIRVNSQVIERTPIELRNNERFEIGISLDEKRKITGWYGYLIKRSRQHYGFNLYKNGRLIAPYQKIGFEPHPEAALLYGELNLDFVPVTHNKREFIENSVDFSDAQNALTKFIKENRVVIKSREISMSEHVGDITERTRRKLFSLQIALEKGPLIEKISNIETQIIPDSELTNKDTIKTLKLTQSFSPDKLDENGSFEFKVENDKFNISFGLTPLGKDEEWVKYFVEKNNITVLINTDFPLYFMVRNYSYYALILIAEAIAEFIVKKYQLPKNMVLKLRNTILKRSGEAQIEEEKKKAMEEERQKLLDKLNKIDSFLNK